MFLRRGAGVANFIAAANMAVDIVTWVTWLIFALDYLVRLSMATDHGRWFYRHLFDLLIVVLPLLRPLRLLRHCSEPPAAQSVDGWCVHGLRCGAAEFVASLAVLDAEQAQAGAQIIDFGQAMWWSITTITTVGYGDLTPLTTTGRVVAVLLMIGGISLVGSITATLASWIVERVADEQTAEQAVTTAHINRVLDEIERLRAQVRLLGGQSERDTER
jgi:voltage-gated potassium channel